MLTGKGTDGAILLMLLVLVFILILVGPTVWYKLTGKMK